MPCRTPLIDIHVDDAVVRATIPFLSIDDARIEPLAIHARFNGFAYRIDVE
jgi:hypothetical protein